MANFVINHPVKALHADNLVVADSFQLNSTSDPVVVDTDQNRGWTVVRTSTGLYTLTFANFKFLKLKSLQLSVRVADDVATIVQGGDWDSSAGTLQIRVLRETGEGSSAGQSDDVTDVKFALANLGADVDNVVSFAATFRTVK